MFARYKLEKLQKKRAANLAKTLAVSMFDSLFQVDRSCGDKTLFAIPKTI
jgi:hypothetical protein